MSATGAAMRLRRTPMLISERNWPGGRSTAQKNKPTLKPRAAHETDHHQFPPANPLRQVETDGERNPGRDEYADRFAGDHGDRQPPRSLFQCAKRNSGVDEPEEKQRDLCRISPPDLESTQRVSGASGEASTKNPGSRAACGRNGMIGTRASAGCRPPRNSAYHDRPPAPIR